MLTLFGKKIRKMRIDKEVRLKDMAHDLEVTSAYLSAVETGKKNIAPDVFESIVKYFGLNINEREKLNKDAQDSRTSVKIKLTDASNQTRELVASFARKLDSLEPTDIEKIQRILKEKK